MNVLTGKHTLCIYIYIYIYMYIKRIHSTISASKVMHAAACIPLYTVRLAHTFHQ
jgi:hypothetical protein